MLSLSLMVSSMVQRIVSVFILVVALMLGGCGANAATGLQAYVDSIDGYEFLYPTGWVQVDVSGNADVVFHDIIQTSENVSVVVSQTSSNKTLTDLGSPEEVGQRLLRNVIAPQESGRNAELLSAAAAEIGPKTYYSLEYLVQIPAANGEFQERHNLSTIAVSRGKVFTLSVSAPEGRWPKVENRYQQIAQSFSVY
ncbi:PsbP [Synechococcus sp. PCC 6312]|nr:PsbP [Synechococcus sp. PCC 6312]